MCRASDGMQVCGRWKGSVVCEFRRVCSKYLDSNDFPHHIIMCNS